MLQHRNTSRHSHTGRIKHNTDTSTNALGGKVAVELASDDSVGTVGAANAAPVDSELAAILFGRGFGNVGHALSEVEVNILL